MAPPWVSVVAHWPVGWSCRRFRVRARKLKAAAGGRYYGLALGRDLPGGEGGFRGGDVMVCAPPACIFNIIYIIIHRCPTQLDRLLSIMTRLRGPSGCEWDRAQDFASIAPYTIEEAYEVADAIERRRHG